MDSPSSKPLIKTLAEIQDDRDRHFELWEMLMVAQVATELILLS